jgi:hypothetical protein
VLSRSFNCSESSVSAAREATKVYRNLVRVPDGPICGGAALAKE